MPVQLPRNDLVQLCLLIGDKALDPGIVSRLAARGIDCRIAKTITEAERNGPHGGFDLLVFDASVYGSESPAACRRLSASWPACTVLLLTDPRTKLDSTNLDERWIVMPCSDRLQDMLPNLLSLMADRLLSAADSAVSRAIVQAVMNAVDDGLTLTSNDGVALFRNAAAQNPTQNSSSVPLEDSNGNSFGALHRSSGAANVQAYEPALDPGTGLVSREVLMECLGHALARVGRSGGRCALLMIDLSGEEGQVASRSDLNLMGRKLARLLRRGDLVARIGPADFAVVLEGVEAIAETARVAGKLLESISKSAKDKTRIGIALSPEDGSQPSEIMTAADKAVARARTKSISGYAYSTDEVQNSIARFLTLSEGLDHALARDELDLHYQPQFELASGKVTGFEALLRWDHPKLGQVSPVEFIPVMESNGLINEAGAWVIRRACKQVAKWQKDFQRPDLSIAVNLSSRQLEDDSLVSIVERALSDAQITPASLELEVTESLLLTDPERAAGALRRLTNMGMPVAIDDFGTGYSSLSYIKLLPVSALKVDRSFLQGIPENEKDISVMRGTIMLAKGLGLMVTAEGVERQEQVECLRSCSCDRVQGFLYGRPEPELKAQRHLKT